MTAFYTFLRYARVRKRRCRNPRPNDPNLCRPPRASSAVRAPHRGTSPRLAAVYHGRFAFSGCPSVAGGGPSAGGERQNSKTTCRVCCPHVKLLPAYDDRGRRHGDGKAGSVAACLRQSGADHVFLCALGRNRIGLLAARNVWHPSAGGIARTNGRHLPPSAFSGGAGVVAQPLAQANRFPAADAAKVAAAAFVRGRISGARFAGLVPRRADFFSARPVPARLRRRPDHGQEQAGHSA